MGAADDIRAGLHKTLGTFTKQRKAEEKKTAATTAGAKHGCGKCAA